jgi:hypothetical protein
MVVKKRAEMMITTTVVMVMRMIWAAVTQMVMRTRTMITGIMARLASGVRLPSGVAPPAVLGPMMMTRWSIWPSTMMRAETVVCTPSVFRSSGLCLAGLTTLRLYANAGVGQ